MDADLYAGIRDSLPAFAAYVGRRYRLGPSRSHTRQMLEAIEGVIEGQTKRLILTISPRWGKTEATSILAPAFLLGLNPDIRIVLASYTIERARESSRRIQDLMTSQRYQEIFPGRRMDPRKSTIDDWGIEGGTGGIRAVGVGGSLTGFGAEIVVIDDPFKDREQADSQVIRDKVYDWYTSVVYTRLEPTPEEGAIIVIHTRWHEDDLIGRLLAMEGADEYADKWTVVDIPAERRGVPTWPDRYSRTVLDKIKANVGPRDYAALYLCSPIQEEGALFRREYFAGAIRDAAPLFERTYRYWDLALSTKQDGDFTAGALVALDPEGCLWVLDMVRMRAEWPEVRAAIIRCAEADGPHSITGVEDVAHQGAALQDLRRHPQFLSTPLVSFPPKGPKDSKFRAAAWAGKAAEGKLRLLKGEWNQAFISECLSFGPGAAHDDQVDAVSGAAGLVLFTYGELRGGFRKVYDNRTEEYFDALDRKHAQPQDGLIHRYDRDFRFDDENDDDDESENDYETSPWH